MRFAFTFLLILIVGPAWGQSTRDRFAAEMAGAVFTSALEFIAPRALDTVSIQQLALWGLRGITTLDASLSPGLADGVVSLRRGNATLFQRPAPPANSAAPVVARTGNAASPRSGLGNPNTSA